MTSIATKTGDHGETSLFNGQRVPKTDPRMEALGALDELTAQLGHLPELEWIQSDLLHLGAAIANPTKPAAFTPRLAHLEEALASLEATLPPLTQFILPGGESVAVHAHVARAVCRRAERRCWALNATLTPDALAYLNRLSDYLFQWARAFNLAHKKEEKIWHP